MSEGFSNSEAMGPKRNEWIMFMITIKINSRQDWLLSLQPILCTVT